MLFRVNGNIHDLHINLYVSFQMPQNGRSGEANELAHAIVERTC